ncbi:MAG: cupin domain-containing protein [Lachnospiraceae bacterium]|nr:cupin domain-containing protein [Lachnospiraceae bacterium]
MNTFEAFNQGSIVTMEGGKLASEIEWSKHSTFAGVSLKHLITAAETQGEFSYHLVRIEKNCSIKLHIHETQLETHEVVQGFGQCICDGKEIPYVPGTIAVIPKGMEHEVNAGEEGLYLFAKFIPALC